MSQESLPAVVEHLAAKYPAVWEAYNQLGRAAAESGPLSQETQRLVKLAIAVGGRLEGAVRSHVRRALREGLTPEQIRQVAVLAITTVGWPSAVAAVSWIEDEFDKKGKPAGSS